MVKTEGKKLRNTLSKAERSSTSISLLLMKTAVQNENKPAADN